MEAPPLLRQVKTQHFKHVVEFSGDEPIDLNSPFIHFQRLQARPLCAVSQDGRMVRAPRIDTCRAMVRLV